MRDARGSVEKLSKSAEPTFQDLSNYSDCMYFRVAFDKTTGEIIGTCRFGKYHRSGTNDCWDFGFNVVLSHFEAINKKITEMVKRIQSGEKEDELIIVYFEELNEIEEFKFS